MDKLSEYDIQENDNNKNMYHQVIKIHKIYERDVLMKNVGLSRTLSRDTYLSGTLINLKCMSIARANPFMGPRISMTADGGGSRHTATSKYRAGASFSFQNVA